MSRTFQNVVPGGRQQNTKGCHDPVTCSGCTFGPCSRRESGRICLCSRPSPQTPAPAPPCVCVRARVCVCFKKKWVAGKGSQLANREIILSIYTHTARCTYILRTHTLTHTDTPRQQGERQPRVHRSHLANRQALAAPSDPRRPALPLLPSYQEHPGSQ